MEMMSELVFAIWFVSIAVVICGIFAFAGERIIRALYNRVPAVRRFFDNIEFEEENEQ